MTGMDFAALSPEVNSARMYAGPGSASMSAAASAWRGLAAELSSVASSYRSVIAELTGQGWLGPASQAMAAAATPYANWLGNTAGLAEQTANQLMQAAADFEQAFAATVPPPVITANPASARARPIRTPFSYSGESTGVRAEPKTLTAGPSSARAPKPSTNSDWIRSTRHGSECSQAAS